MTKSADRFPAPIAYGDIRLPLNAARVSAALVVAIVAAALVTAGYPAGFVTALCAVTVLGDGLWRLRRKTSPVGLLLVDVTATGVALVATGDSPAVEVAAVVYVLTASLLLLAVPRAVAVIAYALAFAAPIALLSPLVGSAAGSTPGTTDRVVALVFIVATALLLVAAGRALHVAAQTQRAAIETERRAVAIKNEFVSMVSHELRTPLTSIAGFTDTLREAWRSLSPDEVDEFLDIMRREEAHLADLVEDILVIPRLDAGQLRLEPELIDLRQVVQGTAQAVFQGSPVEIDVAIPGGVTVLADPVRIGQVLRNLLDNARKYGGDQVLVDGERSGDFFMVVVSDNGPGIPEHDRQRIFEHFEQITKGDSRSDQGVGLGLPIARRLCRAMGGDLWYESRFPIGSRFCFTIGLGVPTLPDRAPPPVPGARDSAA